MKTIIVLMDSLNRHQMECYEGPIKTPNFIRFAQKAITFDNHYAGSLPTIPARREMFTGRINFLHRSWGPLEPFDNTFPELLASVSAYTHLITDDYHYFEDGGWGYHTRYSSWEFFRGQERDLWKAIVTPPMEEFRKKYHPILSDSPRRSPNMVNREFMKEERDFPIAKCTDACLGFLETNGKEDNWLLQLELFDPHEPFHRPRDFGQVLPSGYKGAILDWPPYGRTNLTGEEQKELNINYASQLTMCDHYFGKILDYLDANDLWLDTALILTSDHGLMLGEHDWWGKNKMPMFNEISKIPLMIYHPDYAGKSGERRQALTQTIDIMPTILEFYGTVRPSEVEGKSIVPLLEKDGKIREAALYGIFGGATNITDGRYTYFRYPSDMANQVLYEYTLIPAHPTSFFEKKEFEGAELVSSFNFTKNYPVMRLPSRNDSKRPPMQGGPMEDTETVLYDTETDPEQNRPIISTEIEKRMIQLMTDLMKLNDAPPEAYRRLGFSVPI